MWEQDEGQGKREPSWLSRTWAGQAGLDPGETGQGRLREDIDTSQYRGICEKGPALEGLS